MAMLERDAAPEKEVAFHQLRSFGQHIATIYTSKRALSGNNDKVFLTADGSCRPLGHHANGAC